MRIATLPALADDEPHEVRAARSRSGMKSISVTAPSVGLEPVSRISVSAR